MLKGLEVSIINYSEIRKAHREFRLDGGYFTKEQIALRKRANDWPMLGGFCTRVVCGPFGSTILDTNYLPEGVPMLRPFNLRELRSEAAEVVYLDPAFVHRSGLKIFTRGDVLFARVGEVSCGLLVQAEATISPNIIAASLRDNVPVRSEYIVAFFNTRFGRLQMEGEVKAVAQPTISTESVREFRFPILGEEFQVSIARCFENSEAALRTASAKLTEAEATLTAALGLGDWQPPEPLTYTRPASEAFAAKRLDSQYFAPRVAELIARLGAGGRTVRDVAPPRRENFFPSSRGDFRYIEISDVHSDGTASCSIVAMREAPSRATQLVRTGDVLTSTVRPNRRLSAIVSAEQDGCVASSGFMVLQPNAVPAKVLLTYLRLPLFCELMDLHTSASLYPAISERDLLALPFPKISKPVCDKVVSAVRSAHAARARARELLERAKRAVEIAIEQNEQAALESLEK